MRIGLLSRKASLYSTARLLEAAENRGHAVNSSPGLEGIEAVTGVDVASEIIEFVENHADPDHE